MLQSISYKDRSAFVNVSDGFVQRFIEFEYAGVYEHLMQSGLYKKLVDQKLIITHVEKILSAEEKLSYYKILQPEFITFVSYPYEWSFDQWKDVVLALLQINSIAIEFGMILKDATPYNFTFHNGKSIFFDTTSFEFYEDGNPWIAYKQFCESMLGPLALMKYNNLNWGKLMVGAIGGWELPFISKILPLKSYFHISILMHIHLHSRYTKGTKKNVVSKRSLNRQNLSVLWDMLYRSIDKWKIQEPVKKWSDYYTELTKESEEYINKKATIIDELLQKLQPEYIIDFGANNGKFSIIASRYAKAVLAIESDHNCINNLNDVIKKKQLTNIITFMADITQPTPGVGWKNEERIPLLWRLKGDCLMALALIHHLAITSNIPLLFIARFFANTTSKYAIVEFIPKSDPRIHEMLRNRKDVFNEYNEEHFINCFQQYFILLEKFTCLYSDRKLFVWVKK